MFNTVHNTLESMQVAQHETLESKKTGNFTNSAKTEHAVPITPRKLNY
jgi:hypothetical protein